MIIVIKMMKMMTTMMTVMTSMMNRTEYFNSQRLAQQMTNWSNHEFGDVDDDSYEYSDRDGAADDDDVSDTSYRSS